MILNSICILYFLLFSGIGNASVENDASLVKGTRKATFADNVESGENHNKKGNDNHLSVSQKDQINYQSLVKYAVEEKWQHVENLLNDSLIFDSQYTCIVNAITRLKDHGQGGEEMSETVREDMQLLHTAYYTIFQELPPSTLMKTDKYLRNSVFLLCDSSVCLREKLRECLLEWAKRNNYQWPNSPQLTRAEQLFRFFNRVSHRGRWFEKLKLVEVLFSEKIKEENEEIMQEFVPMLFTSPNGVANFINFYKIIPDIIHGEPRLNFLQDLLFLYQENYSKECIAFIAKFFEIYVYIKKNSYEEVFDSVVGSERVELPCSYDFSKDFIDIHSELSHGDDCDCFFNFCKPFQSFFTEYEYETGSHGLSRSTYDRGFTSHIFEAYREIFLPLSVSEKDSFQEFLNPFVKALRKDHLHEDLREFWNIYNSPLREDFYTFMNMHAKALPNTRDIFFLMSLKVILDICE